MTSGLCSCSFEMARPRSAKSASASCCRGMRTSEKLISGGAMRRHSASLTVLVVGTMRPSLATVAALELGDALEAHQLAELLEVVERRRNAFARPPRFQFIEGILERCACGQKS